MNGMRHTVLRDSRLQRDDTSDVRSVRRRSDVAEDDFVHVGRLQSGSVQSGDEGDSTELTWAISGRSPFMAKVMGLFINMDKLVGKDFERGLENLRSVVEK